MSATLLSVYVSYVVVRLLTKPSAPEDKHVEEVYACVSHRYLEFNPECVCLRSCVGDGGLEGEGDVVSCVIEVRVREGVCVTREVSPLHQLGHAEMLLLRPSAVTLTTELARPIGILLLFLYNS